MVKPGSQIITLGSARHVTNHRHSSDSRMKAQVSVQITCKVQEDSMQLPVAPSHTDLFSAAWSRATAASYQRCTGAQAAKPDEGRKKLQSLWVHAEPWQQHAYFQISIQSRRYHSLKSNLVRDEAQLLRAGMFTAARWKSAKPYAVWSSAPWLSINSMSRGPVGLSCASIADKHKPFCWPSKGACHCHNYVRLHSAVVGDLLYPRNHCSGLSVLMFRSQLSTFWQAATHRLRNSITMSYINGLILTTTVAR